MTDKIKITRKEIEELYDIEEEPQEKFVSKDDDIVISEVHDESWEEATERKDKDNKWLSE